MREVSIYLLHRRVILIQRKRKRKITRDGMIGIKIRLKDMIFRCLLDPIDKSKTSNFFLLQGIWTKKIWIEWVFW